VLRATARHEAADALWLRWTWALDALAEWGAADGLRVELRLPEIVGDDDLATLAPAYATFDGHTMAWEYEGESGAEPLEIALLSPATYGQVRALQKAGAHPGSGPPVRPRADERGRQPAWRPITMGKYWGSYRPPSTTLPQPQMRRY
jgi:hypothetical protein